MSFTGSLDRYGEQSVVNGGIAHIPKAVDDFLAFVFHEIDLDRSGEISCEEITKWLVSSGVHVENASDIESMCHAIDTDGNNEISQDEFIEAFKGERDEWQALLDRLHNSGQTVSLNPAQLFAMNCLTWTNASKLREIFDGMDDDHSGSVSAEELGQWLKQSTGNRFQKSQIDKMIKECDKDGNGEIEFPEFYAAFRHLVRSSAADHSAHDSSDASPSSSSSSSLTNGHNSSIDDILYKPSYNNVVIHVKQLSNQIASELTVLGGISFGSDLSISSYTSNTDGNESDIYELLLPLFAGGIGGVSARCVVAPLETIVVQKQCKIERSVLAQLHYEKKAWFQRLFQPTIRQFHHILANDGFRGLYKGNLYNCCRVFPFGGLVTFTYGNLLRTLPSESIIYNEGNEHMRRFVAGIGAGCLATIATYPLDVLRARATIGQSRMLIGDTLFAQIRGLYAGMAPTLFAMSSFVALQNTSYDALKHIVCSNNYWWNYSYDLHGNFVPKDPKPLTVGTALSCGLCAAVCAQTIVHPLDTLRRRIQVSEVSTNLVTMLRKSVILGGWNSLWNGIVPAYMRVMPSVAVSVTVRDFVLGRMD